MSRASLDNPAPEVAALLNRQLASAIDLHAQVKHAHWNVRGPGFIALHELFDTIAEEVETWSDLLAERASALGAVAQGGIPSPTSDDGPPPITLGLASGADYVDALDRVLGAFADQARRAIDQAAERGDAVTSDVLTQVTREADAARWKINAHREPDTMQMTEA